MTERLMYEDDPEIEHIASVILRKAAKIGGKDEVSKINNVTNRLTLSIMEKMKRIREEERKTAHGHDKTLS